MAGARHFPGGGAKDPQKVIGFDHFRGQDSKKAISFDFCIGKCPFLISLKSWGAKLEGAEPNCGGHLPPLPPPGAATGSKPRSLYNRTSSVSIRAGNFSIYLTNLVPPKNLIGLLVPPYNPRYSAYPFHTSVITLGAHRYEVLNKWCSQGGTCYHCGTDPGGRRGSTQKKKNM